MTRRRDVIKAGLAIALAGKRASAWAAEKSKDKDKERPRAGWFP